LLAVKNRDILPEMSSISPNVRQSGGGGSNGSRESSEFEFVMKNNQQLPPAPSQSPANAASTNPLLITSNQPSFLPTPSISNIGPPPTVSSPSVQPPVITQVQPLLSATSDTTKPSLPLLTQGSRSTPDISTTVVAESPPSPGMFGWVKGAGFLSRVVEKTKSVTENVITTLDPQMKEFIHSGGSVEVIVASDKENKVIPVREAFQEVFGRATVYGLPSKSMSIAEQPVGFASGKQAALERVSTLRRSGSISSQAVIVSVENFLYEVNEDLWIDMSCLILSDPQHKIQLQTFSQPTPVGSKYIGLVKDGTPENYSKQWSGFAVPVGNVMSEELNVPHTSWQEAVTGINRKELVHLAARALAGLYKKSLQAKVENV